MVTRSQKCGATKEMQYLQQDLEATPDNRDGDDESDEEYLGDEDSEVSEDNDNEDISVGAYYSCSSKESK
jgi:hypothetical protein